MSLLELHQWYPAPVKQCRTLRFSQWEATLAKGKNLHREQKMAAQLKETPTLTASESKQLVKEVSKTVLTPTRKEALEGFARMAHEAYKKPIK